MYVTCPLTCPTFGRSWADCSLGGRVAWQQKGWWFKSSSIPVSAVVPSGKTLNPLFKVFGGAHFQSAPGQWLLDM